MLAAFAVGADAENPLSVLRVADRPAPEPGPGWTLVDVRAATLNHHDLWSLRGVGLRPDRLPMILGTDAAGTTPDGARVVVHSVVTDPLWRGAETLDPRRTLLSELYPGTLAEQVAVPQANVVAIPESMDFATAACLPTAYLTAYRMLFDRAALRPGASVLVQGAGGGVASAAVVLGVAAGLRVWVTSRSPGRRTRALELGASGALEPGERLPEQVDAVLETVGQATWSHSLRALRPGGTLVVAGATSGGAPAAELERVFFRELRIVGTTMGSRRDLADLVHFASLGTWRPVIDSRHALSDVAAALEHLASGRAFGKVVVEM